MSTGRSWPFGFPWTPKNSKRFVTKTCGGVVPLPRKGTGLPATRPMPCAPATRGWACRTPGPGGGWLVVRRGLLPKPCGLVPALTKTAAPPLLGEEAKPIVLPQLPQAPAAKSCGEVATRDRAVASPPNEPLFCRERAPADQAGGPARPPGLNIPPRVGGVASAPCAWSGDAKPAGRSVRGGGVVAVLPRIIGGACARGSEAPGPLLAAAGAT